MRLLFFKLISLILFVSLLTCKIKSDISEKSIVMSSPTKSSHSDAKEASKPELDTPNLIMAPHKKTITKDSNTNTNPSEKKSSVSSVKSVIKAKSLPSAVKQTSISDVCVNQPSCPCPPEPMIGDKCGGGVVIKPNYIFPQTDYHLIGTEPTNDVDTLASWLVANEYCDKLNLYGFIGWKMPSCGIMGIWNPPEKAEMGTIRDKSYCEAYFSLTEFGKLTQLSSKSYWTRNKALDKASKSHVWTIDNRLQWDSDFLNAAHPFHCVRHDR